MLLLALLAASPSAAAESESHLAQLAREHGWQTVAAVVSSANQGDLTLSDVHGRLKELGLADLSLPVIGEGPRVPRTASLSQCGWNQGVYCQTDLPAGSAAVLTATCATAAGPVADVSLTAIYGIDPTPDTSGTVHIGDVLPCWAAGGDRVRLTAGRPQATTALDLTVEGQPVANVQHHLAPYGAGIRSCAPGDIILETDELGRLSVLKVERDGAVDAHGTACIQDVLARLRLDGAAKARIKLP